MHAASSGTDDPGSPIHRENADRSSKVAANNSSGWTLEITPSAGWFHFPFRELWEYRDLLWMLVQRDIVTVYKQTILGPVWYLLQPVLTMLMYVLVFGEIAKISTDGIPKPLFYLAGIVIWNFFQEAFTKTSTTFILNAEIFGKVYFPRLLTPLSQVISGLIKFLIQAGLLLLILLWFSMTSEHVRPNLWLLLVPYLILLTGGLGMGLGILFSALTAKYRDLNLIIPFGVQLLMFASPVIYPVSALLGAIRQILWWNPLTHIIETFKYSIFGTGEISLAGLCYANLFTIATLLAGILVFQQVEKGVMDVV